MGQTGFFDVERRLEAISAKGDPLETIKKIVRWEDFRGRHRERDRDEARGAQEQRWSQALRCDLEVQDRGAAVAPQSL
jgi:hypothetical protein